MLSLSPSYDWRKWHWKRWNNLLKIPHQAGNTVKTLTQEVWAILLLSYTLFWGDHCALFINKCLLSWMDQGKRVGDTPCWLKLSVFRLGCHKFNQHRCEVKYGSGLRGTHTCEEMFAHPRKLSVASGEGRFGVGLEGWENIKEIEMRRGLCLAEGTA